MSEDFIRTFVSLQRSQATRRTYKSDLNDFARFLALVGKRLQEASLEDAVKWREELEWRRLVPASIGRKLAIARSFYTFLTEEVGAPQKNPFRRVKPPPFDRIAGKTPCPTEEEVRRLIQAAQPTTIRGIRDRLILLLLFNQGLRVSEATKLRRSAIRERGGHLALILRGKGGSHVETVLPPQVARLLTRLLAAHPGGEYVFQAYPRNPSHYERKLGKPGDRPLSVRRVHIS